MKYDDIRYRAVGFIVMMVLLIYGVCHAGGISYSEKVHFIDKIRLMYIEENPNIPVSLVLAQAIIESDWGRSNYSKENNNLFGLEVFNDEWAPIKFNNDNDSFVEYIRLLNHGKYFVMYRDLRSVTDDSYILTYGLESYSILGKEYIKRLQHLIETENLKDYD